jgi:HSP20 family protein
MVDTATKLTVQPEHEQRQTAVQRWYPFDTLRREMDLLLNDFDRSFWAIPFRRSPFDIEPLWRQEFTEANPAVDIVEKDKAYEITAELPGLDEKDIEVNLANGGVTIRGTKKEEKEEKNKNYQLQERRFGSFERYFTVPEGVDADKIEANFKKGILTVILPKRPETQKPEKKIEVRAAA